MVIAKDHSDLDMSNAVTTSMETTVDNYSVTPEQTYGAGEEKEIKWVNTDWTKQYGYYCKIPELKKAIDALAIYVVGKGYEADDKTKMILESINGWGEDTWLSLMWNAIVTKKIAGDCFFEVLRDEKTNTLINLKPLDPSTIGIVCDKKGKIKRYEQLRKIGKEKKLQVVHEFEPNQILHLCNDRIADNIHGTSVIDSCEQVILARNECMSDWRKVLHRNVVPVRIIEVDTDDTTKIAALKAQYQTAINKGEVLIVPKGNVHISDTNPVLQDCLPTIKYYEDFFYQAVGVPKVVTGNSGEFTESSAKISLLSFNQIWNKEQRELEADLWNQLGIKIKYVEPVTLQWEQINDMKKDGQAQQMNFQQSEIGLGGMNGS